MCEGWCHDDDDVEFVERRDPKTGQWYQVARVIPGARPVEVPRLGGWGPPYSQPPSPAPRSSLDMLDRLHITNDPAPVGHDTVYDRSDTYDRPLPTYNRPVPTPAQRRNALLETSRLETSRRAIWAAGRGRVPTTPYDEDEYSDAQLAEMRREQDERISRWEIEQARQREADKRSEALFYSLLTREELAQVKILGYFDIRSHNGVWYRILTTVMHGNVKRLSEDGREEVESLCVNLPGAALHDTHVAQMLALRTDEEYLRTSANITDLVEQRSKWKLADAKATDRAAELVQQQEMIVNKLRSDPETTRETMQQATALLVLYRNRERFWLERCRREQANRTDGWTGLPDQVLSEQARAILRLRPAESAYYDYNCYDDYG